MIDLFKWFRRSEVYRIRIICYDSDNNSLDFTPIWWKFVKYYDIQEKFLNLNKNNIPEYSNDAVSIIREHLTTHRGKIESFVTEQIEFDSQEDYVEFLLRFSDD